MKQTWFITGCSTGFGRALALAVLEKGDQVVVTSRKTGDVADIVGLHGENAISVALDVTNKSEITHAVKEAVDKFGRIDVLVNNAGIGYFGSVEESEEDEVRKMFDINFWGLADVTRAVLPVMRNQRSGHILNIASIGGLRGFPSLGYYNATKFAVDGFSEALAKEVEPLGIKVTIIAPSGFRTDWAGRSANDVESKIDDYKSTAAKNTENIRAYSGNQPGDPHMAALAMISVVESENPPLRLLLGAAAVKGGFEKIAELQKDFDSWREVSIGADRPKAD